MNNTKPTFANLEHKPHPNKYQEGTQAKMYFANGYMASVVRGEFTYGGDKGLYELAVFSNGDLDYTTPITNDVVGHLSENNVTALLQRIAELPPLNKEGADNDDN